MSGVHPPRDLAQQVTQLAAAHDAHRSQNDQRDLSYLHAIEELRRSIAALKLSQKDFATNVNLSNKQQVMQSAFTTHKEFVKGQVDEAYRLAAIHLSAANKQLRVTQIVGAVVTVALALYEVFGK